MLHRSGVVGEVGVLIVKGTDSIGRGVVHKWEVVMEVLVKVDFVIIIIQGIIMVVGVLVISPIVSSVKNK